MIYVSIIARTRNRGQGKVDNAGKDSRSFSCQPDRLKALSSFLVLEGVVWIGRISKWNTYRGRGRAWIRWQPRVAVSIGEKPTPSTQARTRNGCTQLDQATEMRVLQEKDKEVSNCGSNQRVEGRGCNIIKCPRSFFSRNFLVMVLVDTNSWSLFCILMPNVEWDGKCIGIRSEGYRGW